MRIVNQPFNETLGQILTDNLNNVKYSDFTFISAYAKISGVARLEDHIKTFKQNNGHVVAFIGIDQKNTSYEALINLYELCDQLFVIHSESLSSTFHHKVYTFKNDNLIWIAIGSNNLTAGGLWTNYESAMIHEYNLLNENEKIEYLKISNLFDKYSDDSYKCSIKITDKHQIDELLNRGYILKEKELADSMKYNGDTKTSGTREPLFGSEYFTPPAYSEYNTTTNSLGTVISPLPNQTTPTKNVNSPALSISTTKNEIFWFEMGASTGGSRNILDLSMVGSVAGGSTKGTNYSQADAKYSKGGVTFFDVDASKHNIIKDIKINYNGHSYYPSTIIFAENNGSWRLQLKGTSKSNNIALSKFGSTEFRNNILLFEKISSNEYNLTIAHNNQLQSIKNKSVFYSHNGRSNSSKLYGMLQ